MLGYGMHFQLWFDWDQLPWKCFYEDGGSPSDDKDTGDKGIKPGDESEGYACCEPTNNHDMMTKHLAILDVRLFIFCDPTHHCRMSYTFTGFIIDISDAF